MAIDGVRPGSSTTVKADWSARVRDTVAMATLLERDPFEMNLENECKEAAAALSKYYTSGGRANQEAA